MVAGGPEKDGAVVTVAAALAKSSWGEEALMTKWSPASRQPRGGEEGTVFTTHRQVYKV